jgi:hypothetical protein
VFLLWIWVYINLFCRQHCYCSRACGVFCRDYNFYHVASFWVSDGGQWLEMECAHIWWVRITGCRSWVVVFSSMFHGKLLFKDIQLPEMDRGTAVLDMKLQPAGGMLSKSTSRRWSEGVEDTWWWCICKSPSRQWSLIAEHIAFSMSSVWAFLWLQRDFRSRWHCTRYRIACATLLPVFFLSLWHPHWPMSRPLVEPNLCHEDSAVSVFNVVIPVNNGGTVQSRQDELFPKFYQILWKRCLVPTGLQAVFP